MRLSIPRLFQPRRLRMASPAALLAALVLLAGCATQRGPQGPLIRPAEVRARIVPLLPSGVDDPKGWATDITAAFVAQGVAPSNSHICSMLAVAAQESGFKVSPAVPGLGKIARREIDRRAAAHHVPGFLVDAALWLKSPNGKRYRDRLDHARTEHELSTIFDDFISMVPLGKRLFGGFNPVHTAGPMQVSVAFAQAHAEDYPYPVKGSIRHEVFSRRGGVYFGVAHLFGYPAAYTQPIYRFADFNAGWYASRNAAFQQAASLASGIELALDGDLVRPDAAAGAPAGATEKAVRTLARRLDLDDAQIHRALVQGESADFSDTRVYKSVFTLAEKIERRALPRAVLPGITLHSPKITRRLTTAWFAKRVDARWQQCMRRVPTRSG